MFSTTAFEGYVQHCTPQVNQDAPRYTQILGTPRYQVLLRYIQVQSGADIFGRNFLDPAHFIRFTSSFEDELLCCKWRGALREDQVVFLLLHCLMPKRMQALLFEAKMQFSLPVACLPCCKNCLPSEGIKRTKKLNQPKWLISALVLWMNNELTPNFILVWILIQSTYLEKANNKLETFHPLFIYSH